ncbi:ornithine decarboxylase antizyme-domain-containing protein [Stachybotrys elegans]|uniref:Ornithine decarboxylase antizyme n=1 Tax=Stachybotrys elegans TaxID=80388 RepID=A0A8K0WV90_9HYPO|nr:ornithine decarboxylase antizyme-domain-containing protein [Stachybotrys elegans]
MASIMNQCNNFSSNYGEDVVQRVNVLASCYIVDSAANLKGLHYCTTGGRSGIPEVPTSGVPSPPTSPPLAALTSSNELALLPKNKKRETPGRRLGRRGGAAHSIREECAFMPTPPPDVQFLHDQYLDHPGSNSKPRGFEIHAWLEVWDYAGGASFRAFVAGNGEEKTLFVFFDAEGVVGRDLKKGVMALIELADGPLVCDRIVACLDRRMAAEVAVDLTKSMQWVGFEMTTLDHWAHDLDVISDQWVFMGMEV